MAQTTVNPYSDIGDLLSHPTTGGLDTIIAALPHSPTIEDLVDAVTNYIESVFYPSPTTQVDIQVKSVGRTCINSFVNNNVMGGLSGYNASQYRFIEMLIGNSLTSNLPLLSITDRIQDVGDNLSDNQLTVDEQTPLLLATTLGANADLYWRNVIANIATSPWNLYITGKLQPLGTDVAYWDAAAMNGALAGYAATPAGMIEPSVNFVTTKMVSALIGALTVTVGKVIFNWIPRKQHLNFNYNSNLFTQISMNSSGSGNKIDAAIGTGLHNGATEMFFKGTDGIIWGQGDIVAGDNVSLRGGLIAIGYIGTLFW